MMKICTIIFLILGMMSCGLSKDDLRIESLPFYKIPQNVREVLTGLEKKPLGFANCFTTDSCNCNLKSVRKYIIPFPASNIEVSKCSDTYMIPFELTSFRQFILDDQYLYFYDISAYGSDETTTFGDIVNTDTARISRIKLKEIK